MMGVGVGGDLCVHVRMSKSVCVLLGVSMEAGRRTGGGMEYRREEEGDEGCLLYL